MKKICYTILFLALLIAPNLSYAFKAENAAQKINIVVSSFPIYDYLREILGENKALFSLSLIADNGIDIHNFQPSTKDIAEISRADFFVYNGGDSDLWVKDVLAQAMNKDMIQLNLMQTLGNKVKIEQVVEGMQEESHEGHGHSKHEHKHHEHNHNKHNHDKHEHDEHIVYDEHVWLSLKNAIDMVNTLSIKVQSLDKNNAEIYARNSSNYIEKLENLHKTYKEMFDKMKNKTLIFADRFPFRYLVDDFHLSYYAAFVGCSAETEASFDTIIFLSNKMNELDLEKLIIIDNTSQKIARAVIQSSESKKADILSLNSMQAVNAEQLANGISYISVMQENLETIKKALE